MTRWQRNPVAIRDWTQGVPGESGVAVGKKCTVFNWDDGTPVISPTTGQRHFCFTDASEASILKKLAAAEAAAKTLGVDPNAYRKGRVDSRATATQQQAAASKSFGENAAFDCADGRISLFEGDIFFFPKKGGNPHGIVLQGTNDPDKAFVARLRSTIRQWARHGQLATMTGKTILTTSFGENIPSGVQVRVMKNRAR